MAHQVSKMGNGRVLITVKCHLLGLHILHLLCSSEIGMQRPDALCILSPLTSHNCSIGQQGSICCKDLQSVLPV